MLTLSHAQYSAGFAPTAAMDTLSGGSVGGGGAGQLALDRARGNAPAQPGGAPVSPFGAPPAAAPAKVGNPFAAPPTAASPFGGGGAAEFAPAAPAAPKAGGIPDFNPFAGIREQKSKVIGGQRVYCRISKRLLDDARIMEVPKSEAEKNYFDDGPEGKHGDEFAKDGIYTNITEVKDKFIGNEAVELRRRMMNLIVNQDRRDPMEFYSLKTVSLDSLSELQNEMALGKKKDEKVVEWVYKFLKPYRQAPEDVKSPFFPLYIPAPPPIPDGQAPDGFDPNADITGGQGRPAQPTAEMAPVQDTGSARGRAQTISPRARTGGQGNINRTNDFIMNQNNPSNGYYNTRPGGRTY
ncbi:MAG: hypothetical protein NTX50_15040 [Candidatus Sumerlaeota bacterium]|nr:hypothetical protein [Candidatus Sumerlaeota bacterium]